MDRYAVFGNPIGQSKSPFIHRQFALQCKQLMQYEAILAPTDGFADSWRDFVTSGGKGGNVTVPFKEQAYQLAEVLSARARQAGAVNTLYVDSAGRLCGDNTDGIGLVADLTRLGVNLAGCTVLLLGAGGASRGAIGPLLEAGVKQLVLANRTVSKAQAIAANFDSRVFACGLSDIPEQAYPLIINATSSGLSGGRPEIAVKHLNNSQLAYDMVYGALPTAFMQWAKQQGVPQQADGLGMLLAQAAAAFTIWRGVAPDVEPVMAIIKKQLAV
ncbi:shikimate dehydrogenase [Arsukibacterium sp.]|uniref:shikimate dehydrogenase n=1 Tax=Arsukibacterium sp. TaxID=1977258 RepID=UPI001BD5F19D